MELASHFLLFAINAALLLLQQIHIPDIFAFAVTLTESVMSVLGRCDMLLFLITASQMWTN
jgi:hypothetical protein